MFDQHTFILPATITLIRTSPIASIFNRELFATTRYRPDGLIMLNKLIFEDIMREVATESTIQVFFLTASSAITAANRTFSLVDFDLHSLA